MPRFPSIPQLSIVVPVDQDITAFEASLISVLENRPSNCEIIVAHDGGYDDPFDLADEVRFVATASDSLVDLVQASAAQARGRFVAVLGEGLRATDGWSEPALRALDDGDVGVVTPMIRQELGPVLACGWTDTPHRLCDPVGDGSDVPSEGEVVRSVAPYLQASFWRRDLLRSMGNAFRGRRTEEATYAYGLLAKHAGWRNAVATDSIVCFDDDLLPWDQSTLSRGRRLRAIRHQVTGGGWAASLTAGLRSATACLSGQLGLGEVIGQATAPLAVAEVEVLLFAGETLTPNELGSPVIMPMHSRQRRAA